MITVREADRLILENARLSGTESVALQDACGRVLREDVAADRDYPPFDRVAMDGIALSSSAVRAGRSRFRIHAVQRAGEAAQHLPDPAQCIEIMTGAPLPDGCDAVVRYEDVDIRDGSAALHEGVQVEAAQNVHKRGSDGKAGDVIAHAGTRLQPPHIAALASVGMARVQVAALPRVAVLCTGDELVDAADMPLPHQIRESNGQAIRAALLVAGVREISVDVASDSEALIRRRIEEALNGADILLVSGGVSAGRYDFVPSVLGELGVERVFHRVRLKPGKPLWFGLSPEGQPVVGLPGNPVSALICLYRFVLLLMDRSAGLTDRPRGTAFLTRLPVRKNDFTHFVPVKLGGREAHPVPSSGSGDFLSILGSDGFVEVSPLMTEPGWAPFLSWNSG